MSLPIPAFPPGLSPGGRLPVINAIAHLATGTSFEVTARDHDAIEQARTHIPSGSMISITWLPTDTDDDRIAAARALRAGGFVPLPHIASRRIASVFDADRLLARLADEAGVDRLLLIGGDVGKPAGEFASSLELLSRTGIAVRGYRAIGFGGYPESHPTVPTEALEQDLDTKIAVAQDMGLDAFVINQFAFNADPIIGWLTRFRDRGNEAVVRIGLAGPATLRTLMRYARICGVGASAHALISNGASLARLVREAGPDPVIRTLAEEDVQHKLGPVALHLFPFGGLEKTARWMAPVARGQLTLQRRGAGFEPEL